MASAGTLAIRIVGDVADFVGKMGGAQKALIGIGTAVGGAGIAALRMGDDYDEAADSIRTATGKTGAALDGLEQSFKNVAGRVKEDIGLTSAVLGELHSRTGLTGQALEDMTVKVIEFSRVTGTDAADNTALVTRLFGDWSVATGDQAEVLDQLLRASQATGLEVDALMQTVVQFGAPLRLLGIGFEESIALLGKWEKEGVNTDTMLQGLKFSVKTLAQEGVPASEMAETLRKKIEAIGTSTDPVAESIKLFGLRAGPDLAAAILEGRFSVDDLVETIKSGSETVRSAADDTRDFGDGFAELKNKITTALGPITSEFAGLADAMGPAIYLLPAIGGAIGSVTAKLWLKVAALAAASGGWKAMLLSMGPFALGAAAVGGGLLAIDFGLNLVAEKQREVTAGIKEMDAAEREAMRTHQVFGMEMGVVTDHFANFVGIIAPWHQVSDDAQAATDALNGRFKAFEKGLGEVARGVDTSTTDLETSVERATMGVDDDIGLMETSFGRLPPIVAAAGGESVEEFQARMIELHKVAAWAGAETPGAFSQGLRSAFDNVRTAFTDLKDLMKNTLSPAAQEAELIGIATSKRLAKGLADTRPEVRTEAQQIALDTLAQLHRLAPGSEAVGTLSMQLLASASEAEKPAIRDAIQAIVGVASNQLDDLPPIAETAGTDTTLALAKGLNSATARRAVRDAASDVANIIRRGFLLESPAKEGPWSEKGGPFAWMEHAGSGMAEGLARGMRRGMPGIGAASSALARIGAQAAGAMGGGSSLTLAGAAAGGGGGYAGAQIIVNAYGQDDVEGQLRRALRRDALRSSLVGGFGKDPR